ncbi:hypothetical protein [Massilia sp. BSC265]|nr:hypothetical protein [Massilia sp. BSC265]
MHKQDYLNDEHVKPFLAWMGQRLQAGSPRHVMRRWKWCAGAGNAFPKA